MNRAARAMKKLQFMGMTIAEIEAELGFPLTDIIEPEMVEPEQRKPLNGEILDAEVIEVENKGKSKENLSKFEPIKGGEGAENRAISLPAVIPGVNKRSGERDWSNYGETQRRCKAHRKNGDQCKNAAIRGSTVCRFHGGAAKHVKQAARARLENATDRMAKELLGIATSGQNEGVRLSAIKDALDRGGLKPPTEVAVGISNKPWEEIFDDIACGTREESRRARGYEEPPQNLAETLLGSSVEFIGPQHNSDTSSPTTAPVGNPSASGPQCTDGDDPATSEDDSDPLTATHSHQDITPDRRYRTGRVVTGEDAIRLANLANLRQLPPGRSR